MYLFLPCGQPLPPTPFCQAETELAAGGEELPSNQLVEEEAIVNEPWPWHQLQLFHELKP